MNFPAREPWWKASDERTLVDGIQSAIAVIRQNRSGWERDILTFWKLATNRFHSNLFDVSQDEVAFPQELLQFSVIGSVIDTCESEIAGLMKPRAKFLTKGGRRSDKVKAEKLTSFADGVYYLNNAYDMGREWVRDAALFGDGWIAVCEREKAVILERVLPWEVLFDDRDAMMRKPRTIYRHFELDRCEAYDRWPKKVDALRYAKKIISDGSIGSTLLDPIGFVEAWHLPNGAAEGRRAIVSDNASIEDEEWEEDSFPLVPFYWAKGARGGRGHGVTERCGPVQLELNLILAKIQRHTAAAATKVFCNSATKINESSLNDDEFGVIEYSGENPPTVVTQPVIHFQFFDQVDRLFQRAYELAGLSQLRATAARSEVAGLRSGAAIREYSDVQSTRLQKIIEDYVDAHMRLVNEICRAARRIGNPVVRYPLGDEMAEVPWSEVDIDEDAYVIQAFPTPFLTGSPSFQLQSILELSEVNEEVAAQLLENFDHPDVKGVLRGVNVRRRLVDRVINRILEGKSVDPPDPALVTPATLEQATAAHLDAQLSEESEEILEAFRVWIEQAKALIPPPAPPPMGSIPGMMPAGGMPPGMMPGAGIMSEGMPPLPPEAMAPEAMAPPGVPQ